MKRVLTVMLFASALLFVAGCESPQETRAAWENTINRLDVAVSSVDEQVNKLQAGIEENSALLDEIGETNPEWAEAIDEAVDKATSMLVELQEKRSTLYDELQESRRTLESIPENATAAEINAQMIGKSMQGVSTVLPQPYGAIVAGIGALVGSAGGLLGLVGTRKAKKKQIELDDTNEAFEDTIMVLENAKRVVPELEQGFHKAGPTINSTLSKNAQKKVEAVRSTIGKVTS